MKLRGHHLLCVLGFVGEGYSEEFTENMKKVVERLRKGEEVEIAAEPDEICRACPWLGPGGCERGGGEEETRRRDLRVLSALGFERGLRLCWPEILSKMRRKLSPEDLKRLCRGCRWLRLCLDVIPSRLQEG